jgi:hypothetical protein
MPNWIEPPAAVLASGWVRAWDTAAILCNETGWPDPIRCRALETEGGASAVQAILQELRARAVDERLPWDFIDIHVPKQWFVDDWARRLAAGPPIALAMTKRMLNNSMHVTLEEALDDEGAAQTVNFSTTDTMEAMAAFVARREPRFQGR